MKPVSNFLIYLAQNCIKHSLTHPNDFQYISIHCEKDCSVHFCTLPHVVNFLCFSNIGFRLRWARTDYSRKRTKLNGKVSDLPDRISSVLNVPLSNINVDGYICNERSYRDLKRLEKILEDAKSLQPQSFTTNNRAKLCIPEQRLVIEPIKMAAKKTSIFNCDTSHSFKSLSGQRVQLSLLDPLRSGSFVGEKSTLNENSILMTWINNCLHNQPGSHEVPDVNLLDVSPGLLS